jgi:hypothetical protein
LKRDSSLRASKLASVHRGDKEIAQNPVSYHLLPTHFCTIHIATNDKPDKRISRHRTYHPFADRLKLLVCTIPAVKSGSGVSAKSCKTVPCRPLMGSRKLFLNKDELTPGTNSRRLPAPSFRPIAMSDWLLRLRMKRTERMRCTSLPMLEGFHRVWQPQSKRQQLTILL